MYVITECMLQVRDMVDCSPFRAVGSGAAGAAGSAPLFLANSRQLSAVLYEGGVARDTT